MNDLERRAHEIALAALPIMYDKAKRQSELEQKFDPDKEFTFDIMVNYFDLYNCALFALKKNPNCDPIH